jgi:hypothetical protein
MFRLGIRADKEYRLTAELPGLEDRDQSHFPQWRADRDGSEVGPGR